LCEAPRKLLFDDGRLIFGFELDLPVRLIFGFELDFFVRFMLGFAEVLIEPLLDDGCIGLIVVGDFWLLDREGRTDVALGVRGGLAFWLRAPKVLRLLKPLLPVGLLENEFLPPLLGRAPPPCSPLPPLLPRDPLLEEFFPSPPPRDRPPPPRASSSVKLILQSSRESANFFIDVPL
jgi:hypothetical protein